MTDALPADLETRPAYFDGSYRYWLRRETVPLSPVHRPCCWAMLNPSKAGLTEGDNTTSLAMNLGRRWGCTTHIAVNCFAHQSPYPKDLLTVDDPIGPLNDEAVRRAARYCVRHNGVFVVAWGNGGELLNRGTEMLRLLEGMDLHCIGQTKAGNPRFPRAVPRTQELQPWLLNEMTA